MRKFVTSVTGILLLPCAAGLGLTLYELLVQRFMGSSTTSVLTRFLAGALSWAMLFLFFPRPLRSYIFAHELCHLLTAWISGIRAGALRVHRDGGSVEVARITLWIALAPYVIPVYSVLLLLIHHTASLWWDPLNWSSWLPFGLGLTWSYHLSFTFLALSVPQSDVKPYGLPGASVLILTGNLLVLCLALFAVNRTPLSGDLNLLRERQSDMYTLVFQVLRELFSDKIAIIQS